jgi:hypothetical protein
MHVLVMTEKEMGAKGNRVLGKRAAIEWLVDADL